MSIHYTIACNGDTLFIRTSGYDESLEEVEAYGNAIIRECLQCGAKRVLCDETALEYRLSTLDTFNIGKSLVSRIQNKPITIAIACNPQFREDARFFENVVVNRGLTLRMFPDVESAEIWLMNAHQD